MYNWHQAGLWSSPMCPFPLLGVARLPACSQECPPHHPGIIQVLNLVDSLQHIPQALKSYVDMCVHTCTCVCRAYLYFFPCFINMRFCHHTTSCFSTTPTAAAGPLQGPSSSPYPLLISFPSGSYECLDWPTCPGQWILPCESQTQGGPRIWQGVLESVWLTCSRTGGQNPFLET